MIAEDKLCSLSKNLLHKVPFPDPILHLSITTLNHVHASRLPRNADCFNRFMIGVEDSSELGVVQANHSIVVADQTNYCASEKSVHFVYLILLIPMECETPWAHATRRVLQVQATAIVH
jgi:hypothetical protein